MGSKLFSGEKASFGGNLQRQRARQSERWEVHPTETKYFRLLLDRNNVFFSVEELLYS